MNNSSVYSNQWCEQVFEGRNKMYGAYALRQHYADNTLKGMLFSLLIFCSAIAIPVLVHALLAKLNPLNLTTQTIVTLIDFKLNEIPKQPVESIQKPTHASAPSDVMVKPIVSNDVDDKDDHAKNDLQSHNDVIAFGDTSDTDDGHDLKGGGGMNIIPEDTAVYSSAAIEQLPEFPGGENGLMNYIAVHTNYPRDMVDANVDGVVYMSFVVNKEGKVANVSVLRGIAASKKFEKEAERVLNSIPEWKPGKQNGHTVNVLYMLPIRFALK